MQATRQPILRQIIKLYGAPRRMGSGVVGWKTPTMNDMPQPVQCWTELNSARQAKYNKHLALGVGFFIFSLTVLKASGLCYLNYSPPAQPAARE